MAITITEGLSVLKNINARIAKELQGTQFLAVYKVGTAPNGFKSVDEFEAKAKSALQSITSLIQRRNNIKAAIVASNAVTMVSVAGVNYTVAAAIERKTSIELQRNLIQTLNAQFVTNCRDFERKNLEVQQRLDNLLEQSFGKEGKTNTTMVASVTDDFNSRNAFKLCDPTDAKSKVENMSVEMNDFLTNVDVALSISNATTTIEV